jgi:hypothetical protein
MADKMIVRDGGRDCCASVNKDPVLFEVNDSKEIKEFIINMNIRNYQDSSFCECCGWPGIDFYKDGKRIAITSIKHGFLISWKNLPSDANLTKGTQKWLKKWLMKHGVKEKDIDER